ncbi:hypothetical protein [Solitalea canadensis]|uniref:Uncharacterized protein n=1 Tax=Solitalea canadensis (strain ATCC 29591 / DSM 3403 / JCM 21819 / LMG 8368 / NBRC 15130 / NCIMB 12057 / USAM 9D) TaxID=929556 RepID=H8KPS1_SOLCM|nr:hypothetical protein [Solitalea canadensis]AFD05969.1 hypothetical protein Solca_0854 [Solitalea canadensis DSM 3403]
MGELTNEQFEQLQARIKELEGDLSAKQGELDGAADVIADLKNKNVEVAAAASSLPTVSFDKKKYKVVIPCFEVEGKKYTAADLTTNSKLVAELVKMEAGVLEPVE